MLPLIRSYQNEICIIMYMMLCRHGVWYRVLLSPSCCLTKLMQLQRYSVRMCTCFVVATHKMVISLLNAKMYKHESGHGYVYIRPLYAFTVCVISIPCIWGLVSDQMANFTNYVGTHGSRQALVLMPL